MRTLFSWIAGLGVLGVAASSAGADERITLESAVREALDAGPAAVSVRAAPAVAAAERAAAALVFPKGIELDLRAATDVVGTREGELALDAGLAVDLGDPLRRGLRVKAAEARAGAARSVAAQALLELAARAARAWVELARAERFFSVAVERAEATRAIARVVEARFARGDASELERLQASLDVARAEAQRALAEGALGASGETLGALLGRPPGTPLRAAPAPALPPLPLSGASLLADSMARRPDLAALEAEAAAARARAKLVRSEAIPWPRLELGVGLDRGVIDPDDFRGDAALAASLGVARDEDVLVGVRLVVPLAWTGGPARAARIALAEAELHEARRAAAARALEGEVLAAFARAAAAERAAAAVATAEAAAARALELLGRAYDAGDVGVLDLLIAKDRVFAARESAAAAEAERLAARIDLAFALGRTFPEAP